MATTPPYPSIYIRSAHVLMRTALTTMVVYKYLSICREQLFQRFVTSGCGYHMIDSVLIRA